jgi:hypothetical protein
MDLLRRPAPGGIVEDGMIYGCSALLNDVPSIQRRYAKTAWKHNTPFSWTAPPVPLVVAGRCSGWGCSWRLVRLAA